MPLIKYGSLLVNVVDTLGKPIANATINLNIDNHNISKQTNLDGQARIDKIAVGTVNMSITAKHYLPKNEYVIITENKTTEVQTKLKRGELILELDKNIYTAKSGADRVYISIQSNTVWKVGNTPEWISTSTQTGSGSSTIYFDINPNMSDTTRTAHLFIEAGDKKTDLQIIQSSAIKIMASGIVGNRMSNEIFIQTNNAIQDIVIVSDYTLCVSPEPLIPTIYNGRKTAKFSYTCATMGNSYPFTVTITDEFGQKTTQKIQIDLFKNKRKDTYISVYNMLMDEDDKHAWVSFDANHANEYHLQKIRLEDLKTVVDIKLASAAYYFTINPYNKYIYASSMREPKIFVYHPNGTFVKTITLDHLPDDYNLIYPEDIMFTKTGFGIVNVHSLNSTGGSWRAIDSKDNDRVYVLPEMAGRAYVRLNTPQRINDGYDILAHLDYESPLIIDGRKKVIKEYLHNPVPSPSAPAYFANSRGNKVLMQGYWEAVLMNFPEQSIVSAMYDTAILPIAFSPKTGEENKIYAIIGTNNYSHFALLDFQNRRTEFQFPIRVNFRAVGSSDGKYLLLETNGELYTIENYFLNE